MKRTALTSAAASVTALLLAVGLSACQEQTPVNGGPTSPAATATDSATDPGPQTQGPGTTGQTLTATQYTAPAGNNIPQYLSFSLIPEGFEVHDADDPNLLLLLPPQDDEQGLLAQIIEPDQTLMGVMDNWSSSSSLTNAEYTLGIDTTVGGLNADTFSGTGIGTDGRYVTERAAHVKNHDGQGFFFLLRRAADTKADSEISDDDFYGILDAVVWTD